MENNFKTEAGARSTSGSTEKIVSFVEGSIMTIPGPSSVLDAANLKNNGGNINACAGTVFKSTIDNATAQATMADRIRRMRKLSIVFL